MSVTAVDPRPSFWVKLSVRTGNLVQLAGMVVGGLLVVAAAGVASAPTLSTVLAVLGIVTVAFCSHSIGHWLVGRLAGLRFAYVGVRGTDHPETYPPVIRQVFSAVPMFTTVSTRASRAAVGRWALAAYFAAGQTLSSAGWVLTALLARGLGIPNGRLIFTFVIAWVAVSLFVATFSAKGDYAKAREALRAW